MIIGVRPHDARVRSPDDLRMSDARRSLTVSAKLAMCLQPEFDQASITVVDAAGAMSTWAQDGDLVTALDQLQYDVGEGPCLDSIRTGQCVLVPQLRTEDRWRRYVVGAAAMGVRSQVSAPLRTRGGEPVGALNLYSTTEAHLSLTAPLVAEVLAAQVASALAAFREIESLHGALAASATSGQATGIVMARLEIDADHAAAHLRRASMLLDETLAQVAEDLVRTRQLPSVPPA
jgi:GAF domain-containing protein